MSKKYSESEMPDAFAERGALQYPSCRRRVRQALGKLGADASEHLLVIEDHRSLKLSSRIPGTRWKVTPVETDGQTDEMIRFDPEDSSELPKIDYDVMKPEHIVALKRTSRRGGKVIDAAALTEALNSSRITTRAIEGTKGLIAKATDKTKSLVSH